MDSNVKICISLSSTILYTAQFIAILIAMKFLCQYYPVSVLGLSEIHNSKPCPSPQSCSFVTQIMSLLSAAR